MKLLGAVGFILAVSLNRESAWLSFAGLLILVVMLASLARLGFTFTLRRSYIALPFVMAAIALPFTVPGRELYRLPGLGWTISDAGLLRLGSILLRTWIAVQMAILLTAITRFADLLWAMGALRIPGPLVATIGALYRYLFVLLDEAQRMLRARASRSVRLPGTARPALAWQARIAGSMVGSLFLRALERSERVYTAMSARGYDGKMRSLTAYHFAGRDWMALVTLLGLLILILAPGWMA